MVEYGAVKGRCVEWFSGRVRRLDFKGAESARIHKGGFKINKLFNQVRKESRRNFHGNRHHFVARFGGVMKNNEAVQGVDADVEKVFNFDREEFIDFFLVIMEVSGIKPGIRSIG